jgi:adenosylhomocysteine nucleosidase
MHESHAPKGSRPPRRSGCDVGIVFAVPIEADAFERLATGRVETRSETLVFHEGQVGGRRVAWCVGGVGGPAADMATKLLIAGHRPALVISAGFAGAIDPDILRGSVVRPARSVDASGQSGMPLWTDVPTAAGTAGSIVTVEHVVATVEDKRRLREQSGAQLVDMETHAVARVASAAGLPCGCVRVVSDDATQQLPREVESLARPQSAWRRAGAAVAAIGRRPGAAADLWRLWERAVVDGRTLAHALVALLEALPAGRSGS